jgi:hypothetical protein
MNVAVPVLPGRWRDRGGLDAKSLVESVTTLPPPQALHVPTEAAYGCVDWYPYHAMPNQQQVAH